MQREETIRSSSFEIGLPLTSRQEAGGVFDATILDERAGFVSVLFEGKGAKKLFQNEAGCHRVQRIPPTEKRGRVQTSSITVAVMEAEAQHHFTLDERDVEIVVSRGSGPGGQHRNRTESCVTASHKPSGISVRIDMRSQHESKAMALRILATRVSEGLQEKAAAQRAEERRDMIGTGMRCEKGRTYRERDDRVTDHRTGKTWNFSKWRRGDWD